MAAAGPNKGTPTAYSKSFARNVNGRFQLDRYHLNRALTAALGRDNDTKASVWRARESGEVDSGLRILAERMGKARGEQSNRLSGVYRYMWENR